jgi:hypothetical protein
MSLVEDLAGATFPAVIGRTATDHAAEAGRLKKTVICRSS